MAVKNTFSLLNTAGINSQIIHRENNWGRKIVKPIFLKILGLQLIEDHQRQRMANPRLTRRLRSSICKVLGEVP